MSSSLSEYAQSNNSDHEKSCSPRSSVSLPPLSSTSNTATTTTSAKVVVGVCAMAKKATGKPMLQILARLSEYYGDYMELVVFEERMILNEPVDTWPVVQVLIGFHAKGYPMAKAQAYVKLREPYVINDLEKQADLLDRTKVYAALEAVQVDIPRFTVLKRNDAECEGTLIEHDDHIVVNGHVLNKPFVEKPVCAEDHNIYIYYPSSAGGGSQRLFRKMVNRSSIYSTDSRVRKNGSFVYEEFMPTDGTDVKVYAVGPDYAHAEARKSPALDGKVERDGSGKEIRYPVILTNREKAFARKIVWMFRQTVCGFDLLRANGKSYVCDVNGFSFVKSSTKYYEDTARILGDMIVRRFAPSLRIPWSPPSLDDPPLVSTTDGTVMELRCVLGIIRHGDRTPKQKLKMEVSHPMWHDLFKKYAKSANINNKSDWKAAEVKLKKPNQLQEVLNIVRYLLGEVEKKESSPGSCTTSPSPPNNTDEQTNKQRGKLEQVKTVLEMYGYFSGINRKVQLRYHSSTGGSRAKLSSSSGGGVTADGSTAESGSCASPMLLVVLKWGGELTPAGILQAEELGKAFRCLYPGGQGHYGGDSRGLGFLRLHSTYRHDLKIYASEEGRVQMTAAAFTKGLLALEGELAPILVQMVKSANTDGLLDDDKEARRYQSSVKKYLHQYLQVDHVLDKNDYAQLNPTDGKSLCNALQFIECPRKKCDRIWTLIEKMYDTIRIRRRNSRLKDLTLYLNETWDLAERRWAKLLKDFHHVTKNGEIVYDISKIPDIYDCIKYDLEHNVKFFDTDVMEELYICSKYMADVVVPQEYGIQENEKMLIGQGTCTPLMKKLMCDLKACVKSEEDDDILSTRLDPRASEGIQTPDRHVRTRLYFTSESHIHSLMNVIRWGGLVSDANDEQWQRTTNFLSSVTEFNYMSQLVIMLYEDTTKDVSTDDRFHVELHFSPGALPCIQTTHVAGLGYRPKSRDNEQGQFGVASRGPSRLASIDETKSSELAAAGALLDDIVPDSPERRRDPSTNGRVISAPVNIVAIGDRTNRPITMEELARYSPSGSPSMPSPLSLPRGLGNTVETTNLGVVAKFSGSSVSVPADCPSDIDEQSNYNANVVAVTEQTTSSPYSAGTRRGTLPAGTRRNKSFYADLRHHTTSLLRHGEDSKHLNHLKQLISTAVINGLCSGNGRGEDKNLTDPFLLTTAVIARGASEPNLISFTSLEESSAQDVNDISFYVPPIRSLETLHNHLSLRQVIEFLQRATTQKTPAPSPPKSVSNLSRENSVVSNTTKKALSNSSGGSNYQLQLSAAVSERLRNLRSEL